MNKCYQKYSYYCEGESDEKILFNTKSILLKSKFPICKKHSKIAKGTPRISEISDSGTCCKKIILIDRDNLKEQDVDNFKKKYEDNKNSILVISRPSIESVLYSIFDVPDAELDKKQIEKKLEEALNKNNLKYEHKPCNIYNIIEWVNETEGVKEKWYENLEILKKKKRSNFIDIINFFKLD